VTAVTCRWAPVDHVAPAVVSLTLVRPCCDLVVNADVPTCYMHSISKPVGAEAGRATKCQTCGTWSRITVTDERTL
jgi:hypothetical protein